VRRLLPTTLVRDTEALYNQFHRVVYAYLLRLSGSADVAGELVQETFYRAIRGAAGYRGDSPPAAWLCTIARHCYADQMRRSGRERDRRADVPWEALPDPGDGPEATMMHRELKARIDETMAALPETQRMALLLRDADGLPYETISEILGLSLANVKVTIHRARQRFRARYEDRKE
jgi:RNA polymerase sigma-70 factor (ECF subfamily)